MSEKKLKVMYYNSKLVKEILKSINLQLKNNLKTLRCFVFHKCVSYGLTLTLNLKDWNDLSYHRKGVQTDTRVIVVC